MGCFISTEKRIQRITKGSSFKFLVVRSATRRKTPPPCVLRRPRLLLSQQHGATTQPLERCAELYSEADSDKDGKARLRRAQPPCHGAACSDAPRPRSCRTSSSSTCSASSRTTTRSSCARSSTATTAGRSASESTRPRVLGPTAQPADAPRCRAGSCTTWPSSTTTRASHGRARALAPADTRAH